MSAFPLHAVREPLPDALGLRKARGAFFTPPEISRFICEWAIRETSDRVLEPSSGEASFLLAAGERLRQLGATTIDGQQLVGVELHEPSAQLALQFLADRGVAGTVTVSDFFEVPPSRSFEAVIGNPPYIRYQQFAGAARAKGLQAALAQGVRLNGLASSWAAFTVHAAQFLNPSGRMGLVLPAELLTVSYAAQVRRFLLDRFGSVRLVMFESLVFPGVLEDVVLLLAEGQGPAPCFEVYQARDVRDLASVNGERWTGFTPERDEKWTPALLSPTTVDVYRQVTAGEGFAKLLDWGETYLGAVTGNNDYFALTRADVRRLGLTQADLLPISPPGSRHLRGLSFSERAWRSLGADGSRCYLFYPRPGALSDAARAYVTKGRAVGVHTAYKCRTRDPWWRVPLVPQPDLLLTYMDHDRPRLTANTAQVYHLNSLYGVAIRHGLRDLGRDLLPLASLNSVTLLGAEVVGRAYGGGLLKLEPTEADRMPVPAPTLVRAAERELRTLRPQLSGFLRRGELAKAVQLVDRVLLTRHLNVSHQQLAALREARQQLFSRRIARGRGTRGQD